MNVISMCSGIEAASVAASGLGWRFIALAEIEAFPSAVLAHRYPDVPNLGDMLEVDWSAYRGRADVVVAGTPCQAFSIAGARQSLADARGNLTLSFVMAVEAIDPLYVVWENVPGVLSTKDNAFGCFLGALAGEDEPLVAPGGRWTDAGYVLGPTRAIAWRILDAQYFGLAQRRRRVFVVACPRGGPDPRAVLFEREGVRRDSAPGREAAQTVTRPIAARPSGGSRYRNDADTVENLIAGTLVSGGKTAGSATSRCAEDGLLVTHALRADGFDASEDGTGRGTPLIPVMAFGGNNTAGPIDVATAVNAHGGPSGRLDFESETFVAAVAPPVTSNQYGDHESREGLLVTHTLRGTGHGDFKSETFVVHAFDARQQDVVQYGERAGPLDTDGYSQAMAFTAKDHGADAGPTAPTLRAMEFAGSHANGGGQVAVALASSVRRLTPRECERLQGFPDVKNYVTIRVWSTEQQKNYARAETPNLKSQASASNAGESASSYSVSIAGQISSANRHACGNHVAAHVLIDLERNALRLHSQSGSNWFADIAESESSSPLPMLAGVFVRLLARMPQIPAQEIADGKAASPPSNGLFSRRLNGSAFVHLCGREIDEFAKDAVKFTTAVDLCMRSTTSEVGPNSPSLDLIWETWSCCVAAAIGGFIPEQIRGASSFDICVETVGGYTLVPYRGKPAADGPRYRAIGNSMAVPVVRWIFKRLDASAQAFMEDMVA